MNNTIEQRGDLRTVLNANRALGERPHPPPFSKQSKAHQPQGNQRLQWRRQIKPKEPYINQGKAAKRGQERLKKFNTSRIENVTAELQAERENSRRLREELERVSGSHQELCTRMTEKAHWVQCELQKESQHRQLLEKENAELRERISWNTEEFKASMKLEKFLNTLLRDEVKRMEASQTELYLKHESELTLIRQQADTLQSQLDKEVHAHANSVSEARAAITQMRCEQNAVVQQMTEEISRLQQNASNDGKLHVGELEELRDKLNIQTSLNFELSTTLQGQRCTPGTSDEARIDLAEEGVVTEEADVPGTRIKTPPIWKNNFHFLGLRRELDEK